MLIELTSVIADTWRMGETNSDSAIIRNATYFYPSGLQFGVLPADILNTFPPVPVSKTINQLSCIFFRTGSYSDGSFTMKAEVRDFSGNLKHILSKSAINLKTVAVKQWVSIPLSSVPSDRVIDAGEWLTIHVTRGGIQSGDLNITLTCSAIVN